MVEPRAALAAAERGARLTAAQHRKAQRELAALLEHLTIVGVTDDLIAQAAAIRPYWHLIVYPPIPRLIERTWRAGTWSADVTLPR